MMTLREAINQQKEPWPGRGDWRGRAMGATPRERKFARDIVGLAELTPIQLHKLRTIWRQYLRAAPVLRKTR
jgi:hypothetical protein